ncbi:hypothetical protein [Pseudobacillus badius]|uniref:hypothetical protein n=1 Tax=Bacillus badius TaxID=1455 RepID=UPI0024A57641|nr:hypothetical protein [Bacillus badius]GLY09589.1 hypothetical protein Bbad01_08050 [Bacillus badius]
MENNVVNNDQMEEDARIEEEKQKLERVEQQKRILKRQFSKLDAKMKKTAASLIENAAFMIVTLEDLQAVINREGAVSIYQNGENQWGTKKSPEVEIYNTMIKNHMAIMKQLTDLLPKQPVNTKEGDGFDEFVNER